MTTKATSRIAAATKQPTISGLPQPSVLARSRPKISRNRAPLHVTSPGQSTPRASGLRLSSTRRRAMASAASPIGTLTKKIHSQPNPVVSAPPTSGPIDTARPAVAPKAPKAIPRSRPVKADPIRARFVANITAPPAPWTARASMRNRGVVARPHANDATMKIASPAMKTSRRPKRSASEPAVRSRAASVRA
jgi:hypothetical protein